MGIDVEEVVFSGHPHVLATHPTTIELTRDDFLTLRGDCILGVRCSKGLNDLSERFRRAITCDERPIRITVEAGGSSYEFGAKGDSRLILTDGNDIVIRKSNYICDRTLAILSSASALDIPRKIVQNLQSPGAVGRMWMEVEV